MKNLTDDGAVSEAAATLAKIEGAIVETSIELDTAQQRLQNAQSSMREKAAALLDAGVDSLDAIDDEALKSVTTAGDVERIAKKLALLREMKRTAEERLKEAQLQAQRAITKQFAKDVLPGHAKKMLSGLRATQAAFDALERDVREKLNPHGIDASSLPTFSSPPVANVFFRAAAGEESNAEILISYLEELLK